MKLYFEDPTLIVSGSAVVFMGERIPIGSIKRVHIEYKSALSSIFTSARITGGFYSGAMCPTHALVLELTFFRKRVLETIPSFGGTWDGAIAQAKEPDKKPEYEYISRQFDEQGRNTWGPNNAEVVEEVITAIRSNPKVDQRALRRVEFVLLSYIRLRKRIFFC